MTTPNLDHLEKLARAHDWAALADACTPDVVLALIAEVRRLDAIVGDSAHRVLQRAIDDDVDKHRLRAALNETLDDIECRGSLVSNRERMHELRKLVGP
jgi:hypothetical protein